ncbi:MAG: hypothetical protein RIF36_24625 [Imperialibacter sp.]|uniref:hypothetical protein n=1 Tax=Imperialibacter sp. TaxID=2038411 RepID=UPI0032EF0FB2
MKLTRTLFVVALCYWGLLSVGVLSLPQHGGFKVANKGHLKTQILHSFDLQSVLAGEQVEDDIRSKNHPTRAVGLDWGFVIVNESTSLEDQRNVPSSNALKVFSLYHQFF